MKRTATLWNSWFYVKIRRGGIIVSFAISPLICVQMSAYCVCKNPVAPSCLDPKEHSATGLPKTGLFSKLRCDLLIGICPYPAVESTYPAAVYG